MIPPLQPPPADLSFAVPGATVVAFVIVVLILVGVLFVRRRRPSSPAEFYVASGRLGVLQNTLALFASFIMLTTLFTMVGYISLDGLDALLFAGGFSMSWLVALLVFAEPMRNLGAITLGDLFAIRMRERPARKAAAIIVLAMYTTYIIITMNAFSIVAELMLGLPSLAGKALIIGTVGVFSVLYVYCGGMRGTTRMLVVKAVLVVGVLVVLTVAVLVIYRFNLPDLLRDAAAKAVPDPGGFQLFEPGREYSADALVRWGYISKLFTVVAGAAILPYLFMRNSTVRTSVDARRSVAYAGMMMVPFYLSTTVLGLGALGILGGAGVGVLPNTRDITVLSLADRLGGAPMVAILGAIALLIVAGMVTALLINATTTYMRDVYVPRQRALGKPPGQAAELSTARRVTLIIGLGSVALGIVLLPVNTHFLIPTTVNMAAAGILPAVVYSLFWVRFNTSGLRWSVYGGLSLTLVLMFFSVGVSGNPGALFPSADFAIIPNADVGLIAVPLTFVLGYLGTVLSTERDDARFAEMRVRALTGVTIQTPGIAKTSATTTNQPATRGSLSSSDGSGDEDSVSNTTRSH